MNKGQRKRINDMIRDQLNQGFPVNIISEEEELLIEEMSQIIISDNENLYSNKKEGIKQIDHNKVAFVFLLVFRESLNDSP